MKRWLVVLHETLPDRRVRRWTHRIVLARSERAALAAGAALGEVQALVLLGDADTEALAKFARAQRQGQIPLPVTHGDAPPARGAHGPAGL